MFGLFKSKEERKKEKEEKIEKELKKKKEIEKQERAKLEEELESFEEKYKEYFNKYAFNGKDIIVYRHPIILNNKLVMSFIRVETIKGHVDYKEIWRFNIAYGEGFLERHRYNYLKIKDQMEKLGLKIVKIEDDENN